MLSLRRDPLVQSFLNLASPHVADALDRLGLEGATRGLHPLWSGAGRVVGRAATVKLVPAEQADMCPERGTLEAVRAARPGELLVVDHGGEDGVNGFGGVAAYAAQRAGIVGCVVDGVARNVDQMAEIHFPVFGRGAVQTPSTGYCACAGYGLAVEIGGIPCRPGDVVMADANGVVVVPEEHASRVLELAHAHLGAENRVKDLIARGVDPVEALEKERSGSQRTSA